MNISNTEYQILCTLAGLGTIAIGSLLLITGNILAEEISAIWRRR